MTTDQPTPDRRPLRAGRLDALRDRLSDSTALVARGFFASLVVFAALLRVPATLRGDVPAGGSDLLALGGLLLLLVWTLWQYRTATRSWVADVVVLAALAAIAYGSRDPQTIVPLQWGALFVRAIDLDRRRSVATAIAWWLLAAAMEHAVHGVAGFSVAEWLLVLPGALVVTQLIVLLSSSFARVDRLRRYGDVLASGSPALVAAQDPQGVSAAVLDTMRQLVADLDGVASSVWVVRDDHLVLTGADPFGHTRGPVLISDLPEGLRPDPSRGLLQRIPGPDIAPVRSAFRTTLAPAEVLLRLLVGRDDHAPSGLLVVAAPVAVDAERVAALDRLGTEAGLAFERVALADELADSEALFRGVVQSSSDVIALLEVDLTLRYVSPAVSHFTDVPAEDLVGQPFPNFIHPDDVENVVGRCADLSVGGDAARAVQTRLRSRGQWVHVELTVDALGQDGRLAGFVAVVRDVSARRALEEQLAHQAFHDPLTDLANRPLFTERVERALLRTERSGRLVGVALLDLDDFKAVNDALGHAAGDALLVEVAARLGSFVRATDTAARLGGDEFAIVLDDVADAAEGEAVVRRVLEAFARPFRVADRDVVVRTSAGLAIGRGDTPADTLLRNADVAMYAAKSAGKDRFQLFESSMHDAAVARLELRVDLEGALGRGELEVVYQPIVDIASGDVTGMEALLRWNHPRRGLLAPDLFIPIAEETGLIIPIGRWVLAQACREVRRWRAAGPESADVGVNVNLSTRQFRDPDLVATIVEMLDAEDLPPNALRLEVTETALVEDVTTATEVLAQLHELGVRVAIDDFGTGYSSFGYLRRFLVDEIKIDREFVRLAAGGPEDAALLRAILKVGHTLDLRTVAEGVEEAADLAALQAWGCDGAQGFLLARPMSAAAAGRWLLERGDEQGTRALGA